MKTYKFKLYNSKKNKKLQYQLWVACKVYNHCIAIHKRYWHLYHKHLDKFKLSRHLTKLKKQKKFAYWKDIPSHAICDITDRIDKGYKLFWGNLKRKKKTAPPKFRAWRKYRSFSYNEVGCAIKGNIIRIAKNKYKFFKSREVEGKIKVLTVKRDACGDFYVYLACETPEVKIEPRLGKSIGFDFGLKGKMLVAPNKEDDVVAPSFFKKKQKAIAKASREFSTKRLYSNNRRRAQLSLARLYRKVTNQRKAYHWQLARELCQKYAVICLEDLNMERMHRSYGKKVSDYGFSEFLRILEYVAPQFGTRVVKVDRFYPSSQLCCECGYQNPKVKDLSVREWVCPSCKTHHDRDRNAAQNILDEGLRILSA